MMATYDRGGSDMGDELDFYSANGALAGLEVLDVDALRLMYRLELSGEGFYEGLADRVDHPEAAELLRRNGREERTHAERIAKAIAIRLGVDTWMPEGDDAELLPAPLPDTISPKLFPIIVQAELDGDVGYQRWADNEADPAVARLLRQNGREETQHGKRVQQVIELLGASA